MSGTRHPAATHNLETHKTPAKYAPAVRSQTANRPTTGQRRPPARPRSPARAAPGPPTARAAPPRLPPPTDAEPRTPAPPPPHAPKKPWVPAPPRPSTYTVPLPHGLSPLATSRFSARSPWGPGPFLRPRSPSPFPKNNFSQNSPLTVSPSWWYHSRHRSDGRSTRGCHGPVGAVRFRGPADAK